MKLTIQEWKESFYIKFEPETVEESSLLTRLTLQGKLSEIQSDMNFAEKTQSFTSIIPKAKSRKNKSMIQNKDLKIL